MPIQGRQQFDYFTKFEMINFDEECRKTSLIDNFIIKEPNLSTSFKSDDSIFSSKYGKSLQDKNPYSNRYSCKYQSLYTRCILFIQRG